jgi:hypothetical protein
MKELSDEFIGKGEVKGFSFKLVKRTEHAYMYQVNRHGQHYEVFERRENTRFDTVTYPSSKAFGIWAFCMASFERAELKLSELTQRVCVRTSSNGNTN